MWKDNCNLESQIRETLSNMEWLDKPSSWTFNIKLFHVYLVHGAWGGSHWTGFHFHFLTCCFFIWRRGSWMIIRGNLIKGPGNFLRDLILVLILIFKAGDNESIVFFSIPKNLKKKKKSYKPWSHINKVRNVHRTIKLVWTCHCSRAKKGPS